RPVGILGILGGALLNRMRSLMCDHRDVIRALASREKNVVVLNKGSCANFAGSLGRVRTGVNSYGGEISIQREFQSLPQRRRNGLTTGDSFHWNGTNDD